MRKDSTSSVGSSVGSLENFWGKKAGKRGGERRRDERKRVCLRGAEGQGGHRTKRISGEGKDGEEGWGLVGMIGK